MLEKEFTYYRSHQAELVAKYNGKFLVIHEEQVWAAYDSELEAYEAAKKEFAAGTFLIQKCVPGAEGYTQTFHSRVIFAQ